MFNCDKCGLCCMKINQSSIYLELDRGDGICKFFNLRDHLCSIYDNRPVICNIDKMYQMYFSTKLSLEEYYDLNYKACKKVNYHRQSRWL